MRFFYVWWALSFGLAGGLIGWFSDPGRVEYWSWQMPWLVLLLVASGPVRTWADGLRLLLRAAPGLVMALGALLLVSHHPIQLVGVSFVRGLLLLFALWAVRVRLGRSADRAWFSWRVLPRVLILAVGLFLGDYLRVAAGLSQGSLVGVLLVMGPVTLYGLYNLWLVRP